MRRSQSDQDAPASEVGGTSGIPVVGLGGSAGALEPFRRFLTSMPAESGAAFVVVQHLAPTHASLLTELLAQYTRMRVMPAQDGVPVEANCVYVIPPHTYLGIRDGILSLAEPVAPGGNRMPIDFFFRALAEDRRERAVGILFSGAGADGAAGVRAVRGAGGLTIAQDPQSAQFGDMPRTAIATGLVDYVLPPDRMADELLAYLRQPYVWGGEPAAVLEAEGKPGGFTDILGVVLAQTGSDFRCYKKSTTLRRIERRMGVRRIADLARYYDLLRRDANEVGQLFKDLLINVTAFFRDAEAFEELCRQAISPLIQAKPTDEPLRAWVVGCASGEEAYSLAMLLAEEVAATRKRCAIQVFATDLEEETLQFARAGIYPGSSVADVGEERLARFFVRKDNGYQVVESLRKSVVFAAHNLITDPPFSKMDLVSCRNLLIYLDAETQTRVIPLFNFALNPGGYLFLGKSEGVGGQPDLFAAVSKQARLYRRLTPARPIALESPILPGQKRTRPGAGQTAGRPPAGAFSEMIRQALLHHFAASVVLVNRRGHILQFHGQTGKYLNMPATEPTLNLFDIAKEGLSPRIRTAVHTASDNGKTVVLDGLPITREDGAPCVRVTITPSTQRGEAELLLAVIFEDVSRPVAAGVEMAQGAADTVVTQLEDELRDIRVNLQCTIEELRASNEELQAANEEVVSTNEELQSTNEELETSTEELQSVNEELITVNSQLQEKLERLDTANSDLENLLASTQIATLFLDADLRIRFFTPASTQLLKLIPSDTGRPLSDLSMDFLDYDLTVDARVVAREGSLVEREVQRAGGSAYLVRLLPYRTASAQHDGVVVTFSDVTRLRHAEQQTRRLATVVRDSNDAVILVDTTGNILAWNSGAEGMYGWSEIEALRMNLRDVTPPDGNGNTADLMLRLLADQTVPSFETQRRTKDGRVLDVWVTATAIWDESRHNVEGLATTERDITQRKQADVALRQAHDDLERRVEDRTAALSAANHTLTDQTERLRALASDLTLAEQRERRRLATVLHDEHQQLLVAAKLQVTRLERAGDARVQEACREVTALLEQILALNRSLTQELSPPILQTGRLIPAIEWLAGWMAEKYKLQVVVQADPAAVPNTEELTVLLFQAVRELLFNVVKHTQGATARVEIALRDDQVRIEVSDAGVGFDPTALRVAGGPAGGFGLFSIQQRLGALGGRLAIDSAPGQGSRFTLWAPVQLARSAAGHVPIGPNRPEHGDSAMSTVPASSGSRKIRILMVDDHALFRQGLMRALAEEPDLEIVGEAANGKTAVELTQQLRPDVVLMDIRMPVLNGIDATRLIHAACPTVRVIGLSAFEAEEVAQTMREAGAVAFFSKAGPVETLIATIRGGR